MASAAPPAPGGRPIRVLPADEAGFLAIQSLFGDRGPAARCQCQRDKLHPRESFAGQPVEVRAERLREQVEGDGVEDPRSCGLVAFLDEHPVGWCGVEPRCSYRGLVRSQRVPWDGRREDRTDPAVWALTCLYVRPSHRRQGVSRTLVAAGVDAARTGGARFLEAYPMTTADALSDELHPGLLPVFLDAGFDEVTRPTKRRAVVRLELAPTQPGTGR